MWEDSVSMPPEAELDEYADSHLRRSENGAWAIRMQLHGGAQAPAVSEAAVQEYMRLAGMGLDILAFASVPSVNGWRLFTITPWIEGLQPCSEKQYKADVEPILDAYATEGNAAPDPSGTPRLNGEELRDQCQYSWLDTSENPFLHDVDPRLEPAGTVQNTNNYGGLAPGLLDLDMLRDLESGPGRAGA
jgi:hypothetical protein